MRCRWMLCLVLTVAVSAGCKKQADDAEKPPPTDPGDAPPAQKRMIDRETTPRAYAAGFLEGLPAAEKAAAPATPKKPGEDSVTVSIRYPREATYTVALDRSAQVLSLHVPEDLGYGNEEGAADAPLLPSLAQLGPDLGHFLPAAVLGLKAKQFDDGLYAAVEGVTGRSALLQKAIAGLGGDATGAAALLVAAARLGGDKPAASAAVSKAANRLIAEFIAEPLRSKPLGFYTWSEALYGVFQRDRMLQSKLTPPQQAALAKVLQADAPLAKDYEAALRLPERLTNPFVGQGLRPHLAGASAGKPGSASFLPPSRSFETDLIKRMYGNKPIPDGFNLADEMIARIQAKTLDLTPRPTSGWYDHQTWALEPLIALDRMPEGRRLSTNAAYRKELVGLFKALLALTRETHIKQLEIPKAGAAAPGRDIVLEVRPGLTVEPLASYYLRRARSYRFVTRVLTEALGKDRLASMKRLTAAGAINVDLPTELRLMETIFYGADLTACGQIGLIPEAGSGLGSGKGAYIDKAIFRHWALSTSSDPDLSQDVRMMVPVFYDRQRGKTKVWAVLGMATRPLTVGFQTSPKVMGITRADGTVVDDGSVRVDFDGERHELVYMATAEVYVDTPLNRAEFRALCDKHRTYPAIVKALQ